MSDPALIAELQNAGVDVSPEDAPAVVLERLQAAIVRLLITEPAAFDRARYDRLMELWTMLQPEREKDSHDGPRTP